jgi:hypothetical protein
MVPILFRQPARVLPAILAPERVALRIIWCSLWNYLGSGSHLVKRVGEFRIASSAFKFRPNEGRAA